MEDERRKREEGEECNLERGEGRGWGRKALEEVMRRTLRREMGVRGIMKRKGKGGRWVLIVEMKERRDEEELLEKGEEIGRLWRIGVDKNLSMEKRKRRWRMVETAGRERAMRKRVEVSNRELRVEGEDGHGMRQEGAGRKRRSRRCNAGRAEVRGQMGRIA